jgi:hypothetical protein
LKYLSEADDEDITNLNVLYILFDLDLVSREFNKMLEQDKKYLQTCLLTENDPAVIFQWNYPVLEQFVKGVNSCYEPKEVQSYFITTLPGQMTVESLMDDIMATLAKVAGGRNGHTVLAPNSLSQFGNISSVLGGIWADRCRDFNILVMNQSYTLFIVY